MFKNNTVLHPNTPNFPKNDFLWSSWTPRTFSPDPRLRTYSLNKLYPNEWIQSSNLLHIETDSWRRGKQYSVYTVTKYYRLIVAVSVACKKRSFFDKKFEFYNFTRLEWKCWLMLLFLLESKTLFTFLYVVTACDNRLTRKPSFGLVHHITLPNDYNI